MKDFTMQFNIIEEENPFAMNCVCEMEKRQHALPRNKQPVTQTFSLIRVLGFAKKRDTINFPYLGSVKNFKTKTKIL